MPHRGHLSHHKDDGKRTKDVFETKDYPRLPSLEVAAQTLGSILGYDMSLHNHLV